MYFFFQLVRVDFFSFSVSRSIPEPGKASLYQFIRLQFYMYWENARCVNSVLQRQMCNVLCLQWKR